MPFVSKAQQGWAHAHPEEFGKENLKEFDAATKGEHNLPEHVHKSASYVKAYAARKQEKEKS